MIERKIAVAIMLIKRSSPLPLTLITDLLYAGVDVAELERHYAN